MANFIESPGHEQNLRDNWCSIDTYVVVRKNQTFSFLQAYTFMAIAEFTTESGLPGIMP